MPLPVRVGRYEFDRAAYDQSSTASMFGVTRQHIAKQVALGRIRVIHVGRRVLIPAAEIARLLGEQDGAAAEGGAVA